VSAPLHPNLARLAAAYDDIFVRWTRGTIDAEQARIEIAALVARDDEGILWSIDPDNGQWLRRTITGDVVPGTPPTYGLATPTPHDLSGGDRAVNPDLNLHLQRVDDELLFSPSSLAGSTRRPPIVERRVDSRPRWLTWVLAAVAVAGVAWGVSQYLGSSVPADLPVEQEP
jgi:hypothetical protein